MNKALEQLYRKKWDTLIKHSEGLKAAHPLLIQVSDDYIDADLRVMIVGQETDGWIGELFENEKPIEYVQEKYFNYLYSGKDKNKRAFWNRKNFKFFKEVLTKKYPSKKVELIWNNVSKIGKISRGKPTKDIEALEKNYLNVFNDEVNILQPNIIIFTSGNRATPLRHQKISPTKKEPVSQVILEEHPEIYALRSYHPNAKIKGGKNT